MTLHCLRRVAFADGCLILQVGLSVELRSSGIENAECAVLPFDKSWAAMPLLATARAIAEEERNFASRKFRRNVLPVPPGASMKRTAGVPESKSCVMQSLMCC